MICKKCGGEKHVKAGSVNGEQRYRCKDCGCQFVPKRQNLYISGLSLRRIAKAVNADVHAVHRRILDYGRLNYEKAQPKGVAVVVELDEMWHFLNAKKTKSG
jgi:transposase-like protein